MSGHKSDGADGARVNECSDETAQPDLSPHSAAWSGSQPCCRRHARAGFISFFFSPRPKENQNRSLPKPGGRPFAEQASALLTPCQSGARSRKVETPPCCRDCAGRHLHPALQLSGDRGKARKNGMESGNPSGLRRHVSTSLTLTLGHSESHRLKERRGRVEMRRNLSSDSYKVQRSNRCPVKFRKC